MSKPIFVHIPKTAGSSIRTLITANYAPEEVLNLKGGSFSEAFSLCRQYIGKTDSLKLIQGHTPYGTHHYLGERFPKYFCFLREPVARTISEITYVRHKADHPYCAPGHPYYVAFTNTTLTLGELIKEAKNNMFYFHNTMTNYLSSIYFGRPITSSEYGMAVDNLWNSAFVGIQEHFEESLLIMARRLGWKYIVPEVRNIGSEKKDPVQAEDIEMCKSFLRYDLALYDVGREIFYQDRRRYGNLLIEAAQQMRAILSEQINNSEVARTPYLVGEPLSSTLHVPSSGTPLAKWLAESANDPT